MRRRNVFAESFLLLPDAQHFHVVLEPAHQIEFFPETQVLKNPLNYVRLADKTDDAHLSAAFEINEQTGAARTGNQS